jgi:hypothetical protein
MPRNTMVIQFGWFPKLSSLALLLAFLSCLRRAEWVFSSSFSNRRTFDNLSFPFYLSNSNEYRVCALCPSSTTLNGPTTVSRKLQATCWSSGRVHSSSASQQHLTPQSRCQGLPEGDRKRGAYCCALQRRRRSQWHFHRCWPVCCIWTLYVHFVLFQSAWLYIYIYI